jgi:hypothetical protein
MMEILINESEWREAQKEQRLREIVSKLRNNGWEKFGHHGTIVMFKDFSEENAREELRSLGIGELRPESWEENDTSGCKTVQDTEGAEIVECKKRR